MCLCSQRLRNKTADSFCVSETTTRRTSPLERKGERNASMDTAEIYYPRLPPRQSTHILPQDMDERRRRFTIKCEKNKASLYLILLLLEAILPDVEIGYLTIPSEESNHTIHIHLVNTELIQSKIKKKKNFVTNLFPSEAGDEIRAKKVGQVSTLTIL